MKLNVGCGRNILEGWINLDSQALPGVNIIADLNTCASTPLPLEDDSVDEFLLSHVMEHIPNVLPMMQELYRVARPGARMVVRVPHGASDDAFEDPTHVRQMFHGSFGYFSQPYYWRADYGYRGDWITDRIELTVADRLRALPQDQIWQQIQSQRNSVVEMVAHMRAAKPARMPLRELQNAPQIVLV
ncbi:methyltransferase domain-containing protein [Acidovorax sp. Leaf160]|uniref:class I SAM-dependent methyltransferase n=1 Tax=Acidovorax sp. Leaf160 TaxID=1736280 RepID=UPI0006FF7932|nr:methyltransferase domain-containing protein [Acidovorax sp. Leaf160]KQR57864.1 hypothetical protein ASF94_18415 [Acidovorax sp. Leaf160]